MYCILATVYEQQGCVVWKEWYGLHEASNCTSESHIWVLVLALTFWIPNNWRLYIDDLKTNCVCSISMHSVWKLHISIESNALHYIPSKYTLITRKASSPATSAASPPLDRSQLPPSGSVRSSSVPCTSASSSRHSPRSDRPTCRPETAVWGIGSSGWTDWRGCRRCWLDPGDGVSGSRSSVQRLPRSRERRRRSRRVVLVVGPILGSCRSQRNLSRKSLVRTRWGSSALGSERSCCSRTNGCWSLAWRPGRTVRWSRSSAGSRGGSRSQKDLCSFLLEGLRSLHWRPRRKSKFLRSSCCYELHWAAILTGGILLDKCAVQGKTRFQ